MKIASIIVVVAAGLQSTQGQLVTCPGFPGYCSEAYPGDTCTVVCAFGRNNVPLCQPDGSWTDVPRCIEHEPGKPQQKTGWCPGIPGYCSDSPPGSLCEFDCLFGKDISSLCTTEGTWDTYPTCEGDIRETRDGCDGCPGPFGGPRDRSKEGGSSGSTRKQTPSRKQGNNRNNPRAIGGGNRSKQNNVANTRSNGGNRSNNRNAGNRKNNNRNKNGGNRNNNRNKNGGNRNNNRRNNNRKNNNNNRKNNNRNGGNRSGNNRSGGGNKRPGASQGRTNNRSQISAAAPKPTNRKNGGGGCTEEVLTKCMDVCPSEPINIFKACIKGCAKRC